MAGEARTPKEPRHQGWHQVAFSREVGDEPIPAAIGDIALVLVRLEDGVHVYDAHCPHRGAHLGYGGQLDGEVVVCPFHGRRIALGTRRDTELCVREHQSLDAGGSVFVLLAEEHENGFADYLSELAPTHCFVPGFSLAAPVPAEVVVENAVDADHFHAVHGIDRRPRFEPRESRHGELAVESTFDIPRPNPWQAEYGSRDSGFGMRFVTRVFSPNLVATELGDRPESNVVFTAATPTTEGTCTIRVTAAVPLGADGEPPEDDVVLHLLRDSRTAFEQDMVIWEHLRADRPCQLTAGDWPVAEYHRFCERFRPG